jgi:uncharacterized protein YegJ (DUF2314 family)
VCIRRTQGIADSNGVEHFRLVDIKRNGANLSGIINNHAEIVRNAGLGRRYMFTVADISNWTFHRNGKNAGMP